MYLGLDLRGGVHFLLQVDMKGRSPSGSTPPPADLRSLFRDKNIRHAGITRDGQRVVDPLPRSRHPRQGPQRDRRQPAGPAADRQGEGSDLRSSPH